MISKPIKEGIVEFCLKDRKTILQDEFINLTDSNLYLLKPGIHFITNQIKDAKNLLPILQSFSSLSKNLDLRLNSGGSVAYYTCLILKTNTIYETNK